MGLIPGGRCIFKRSGFIACKCEILDIFVQTGIKSLWHRKGEAIFHTLFLKCKEEQSPRQKSSGKTKSQDFIQITSLQNTVCFTHRHGYEDLSTTLPLTATFAEKKYFILILGDCRNKRK